MLASEADYADQLFSRRDKEAPVVRASVLFKNPSVDEAAQIEVELRAGHHGKRVAQLWGNEE